MKTEFMKIYEELEQLTEANLPAGRGEDYALYTAESPVRYKIWWPNTWYEGEANKHENSGIPFKQAVEEIVSIISKLPREKKFGITISCEFLLRNTIGVEAFYLYTYRKEFKMPAVLRFNTRSATPAPDFVRDAAQKIIDILSEVAKFKIEEGINVYEELDTLNEVFTYTEDEILSDEELKEVTAKVAELEPEYEKAVKASRAKFKELKAAGRNMNSIWEDPEYKKLFDLSGELYKQLSPFKKKLDRHNEIIKYQTATDSQVATEEDWDRIIGYEWEVTVEDLDISVHTEEDEYPSGWDSSRDAIIWSRTTAQSGTLSAWTVYVEVTKEQVADFLNKEVAEVTTRDIMDFDDKEFTDYLSTLDEVIAQAEKEASEAVDNGDYDYDSVSWDD